MQFLVINSAFKLRASDIICIFAQKRFLQYGDQIIGVYTSTG